MTTIRPRPWSRDRHRAAPCSPCRRARKRTPAASPGPACSCRTTPTLFQVLRKNGAEQLGAGHLDIATATGTVIARHALAPAGAGAMVRDHGHVLALEQAAMTAASPAAPHRRKQRIPPGPAALAAAGTLRAAGKAAEPGDKPAIDLARYAAAARGRNTLT